jgi:digeranylgeranylglycerophospholipid reductase
MKTLKRFSYIDEDLIETYSYGGCIHSSSLTYNVHVEKKEPFGAFVIRKKFDNELVRLAINSGVSFREGKKVIDIKKNQDNANILLDDGTSITSQLVIGADGVWSTTAKKSGLRPQNPAVGICIVQEVPASSKIIDKYFTKKKIGHLHIKVFGLAGYGWVFPKDKYINIGVGQITSATTHNKVKKNLKDIYNQYITLLKKNHEIPSSINTKRIKGAALPMCPLNKTYADRLLLCGDAAGLINPLTGDGIEYAMVSGQIASEVCKEAIDAGDTSASFLSRYQKRWQHDFGKDIKFLLRAQKGWSTDSEKVVKLIASDKKLAEIGFALATGNISIQESRFKLIRCFLISYIRNLLTKK